MAASYSLVSTDDMYAWSGEPDLAHGSLSGLATGYGYPHPERGWVTYLKFDLSGL